MDEAKKAWNQAANRFNPVSLELVRGQLPGGLYVYNSSPLGWWLERTGNRFDFPFKVYGSHNHIVSRIREAWSHVTSNMGVLLNGNKGCIAGDADMIVNRAGKSFHIKLADLVHMFNGGERGRYGKGYTWDLSIPTYVQGLGDDRCGHKHKIAAATESGVQEVWEIVTDSGNTLMATDDHRFWTPSGWVMLRDLVVGAEVGVLARTRPGLYHEAFSRIVSITPKGARATYDLTMADGTPPNFVASGLVVHNSGKTVCVQEVANWAIDQGLPALAVYGPIPIVDVLTALKQDALVIFDEFEKTHSKTEEQHALLTAVDGMTRSDYRRLFLFTTNAKTVDENFIDRPSRIRYVWEFGNLEESVVREILDDLLIPEMQEHRSAILTYLMSRRLISIDIVKAVINEVNIFKQPPESFSKIMNISERVIRSFQVEQIDQAGNVIREIAGFMRVRSNETYMIRQWCTLEGRQSFLESFGTANPYYMRDYGASYLPWVLLHEPFLASDDPSLWVASLQYPVAETWLKAYPKFVEAYGLSYRRLDEKPDGWRVPDFAVKRQKDIELTQEDEEAEEKWYDSGNLFGGAEAVRMLIRITPNYDYDISQYKVAGTAVGAF